MLNLRSTAREGRVATDISNQYSGDCYADFYSHLSPKVRYWSEGLILNYPFTDTDTEGKIKMNKNKKGTRKRVVL